jgi:hypothetical protein
MILPCFGFFLLVFVACGLTSLVAAADPHRAVSAPKVYPVSFAGIGLFGLMSALRPLGDSEWTVTLLFIGMPLVMIAGALIGYRAGVRRYESAEL